MMLPKVRSRGSYLRREFQSSGRKRSMTSLSITNRRRNGIMDDELHRRLRRHFRYTANYRQCYRCKNSFESRSRRLISNFWLGQMYLRPSGNTYFRTNSKQCPNDHPLYFDWVIRISKNCYILLLNGRTVIRCTVKCTTVGSNRMYVQVHQFLMPSIHIVSRLNTR